MRVAGLVVLLLLVLVCAVFLIGWRLPVEHRGTREVAVGASPESVYALISRPADYPRWRSDVKRVDLLAPGADGHPQFREIGSNGAILYHIEQATPTTRLVTRIADPKLPFGGTWTYDVISTNSSTTLRITEDGEVYNPLFRFVSRYIMGQTRTMDHYLADVGREVGRTKTP
jgi:polyketide cyclase/dehydrase/lipid transport protein